VSTHYLDNFTWYPLSRLYHRWQTEELSMDIDNVFRYHPPFGNQAERYTVIRATAKALAYIIQENTPASREQSLALTHLQEAVMWANAAIAINEQAITAPEAVPPPAPPAPTGAAEDPRHPPVEITPEAEGPCVCGHARKQHGGKPPSRTCIARVQVTDVPDAMCVPTGGTEGYCPCINYTPIAADAPVNPPVNPTEARES
jgi:hypothetical protein